VLTIPTVQQMAAERDGNGRHSQKAVKNVQWNSGHEHPQATASHEERVKVPIDHGQGCERNRGEP
jgi:hypothetical protein